MHKRLFLRLWRHLRSARVLRAGGLTARQRWLAFLALGVGGAFSAMLPCFRMEPPPLVRVAPGPGQRAHFLAVPGVGRRRADALSREGLDALLAAPWGWKVAHFLAADPPGENAAPPEGRARER
jgi:hypothetical protein